MKIFKYIIFILLGCNSPYKESLDIQIIQINEKNEVKLSDFIEEVEFIPLSEKIDVGLVNKIIETKNYFILVDSEFSLKLVICNKNFDPISEINRYGEGPEEYLNIVNINFNEEKNLVEILTSKNILQYRVNGDYVNSFDLPFFYIENLINISKNEYLAYSQNIEFASNKESDYLIKWNIESNEQSAIIKHNKNMAVLSTRDKENMYKHGNTIYSSHVFLDTIYTYENSKLKKIVLDFPKQNLPLSLLTYEMMESQKTILDTDQFAFHYPFIRVSNQFFISKYIINNTIYFFIQNKFTNNVISGRKFIDDMNSGITYINPIHLDQEGNLYTIHEYEELWAQSQNKTENTQLNNFIKKIEADINYVLIKYKLKDF